LRASPAKDKLKVEGIPMNIKYRIELQDEQRQQLEKITSSGMCSVRLIKRAQILLKSDRKVNWSYAQISAAFDVSSVTISKVRKAFVEQGIELALQRKKPQRAYEHTLDGEGEAHLIALACGQPPSGRQHWSLRLLRDHLVKLGHVDSVSYETIRRVLKKTNSSRGLKKNGVFHRRPTPRLFVTWKMSWKFTNARMMLNIL
jgi:Spy/CpxP family protein refolding chaperone